MVIYIIIGVLFFVQIPVFSNSKNKLEKTYKYANALKIVLFLDFAFLIAIAGFRGVNVGTDLKTYSYWFRELNNYGLFEIAQWTKYSAIEIGYGIIAKLSLIISQGSIPFTLIMFNAIMFYCIYKVCVDYSSNIVLSVYLFITFSLYNQSFNINGQCVAAAIVMLSLKYIEKKDIKCFLLIIFVAFLIHRSAIFMLILYPFGYLKKDPKKYSLVIIGCSFILSLSAEYIIPLIVRNTIYSSYLSKEVSSETGIGMVMNALILMLFYVFYKQMSEKDSMAYIWLYAAAMTLSINFFIKDLAMIGRLMVYFKYYYMLSIPSFIKSFKDSKTKLIFEMGIVFLFAIYYYHSIQGSCFGTVPYSSEYFSL